MASVAEKVDVSGAMVDAPIAIADWLVIAPVGVPLLAGALVVMIRHRLTLHAVFANIILGLNLLICGALLVHVMNSGPIAMTMGRWLPPFGISFSVDLTGAILVLAAAFVAFACGIYSLVDTDYRHRRYGFYAFFLMMMAGVNGAFLTGDVFNLYVWFEVLLIASFGLVVLGSEPRQLDGALKYAFLNLIGTTLFLIATGYLYGTFGSLNMADITMRAGELPASAPITTIWALYTMAFAMKAAAFPLNFWLPASYHTPRIVVSALFAGLLTKVGVYAMMRISVMMLSAQRDTLEMWIAAIAAATMLVGVIGALAQSDARRLLGYLVIAGIGTMLAGIAISGEYGLSGAIFYAVHSMIVMSALYLALGVMGRRAGTFELRELGGQYAAAPVFAFCVLIAAFSVAGLPPLSGFWPKLLVVKAAIYSGQNWLAGIVLLTALLSSIAIMRVWLFAFWRGGPEGVPDGAQTWKFEPLPAGFLRLSSVSLGILMAGSIALGLYPEPLLHLSADAARGIGDPSGYINSVFGEAR